MLNSLLRICIALAVASALVGASATSGDDTGDVVGHLFGRVNSTGVDVSTSGGNGSANGVGSTAGGSARRTRTGRLVIHRSQYCYGMNTGDGECAVNGGPGKTDPQDPDEPRAVTWDDLANFPAHRGSVSTEPAHVIVVGLATNFVSSSKQHTVSGELNGQRARVRFTPIDWTWEYGDGTTRHTSTAGATWAALDQPEFSRTATSHTYAHTGEYTIRTSVTFRAEYSVGGGAWTAVSGTLTLGTGTFVMQAYTADTVLVDETCTENPDGPGC